MVGVTRTFSYMSGDFANCQINLLSIVPVESVPAHCFSLDHERHIDTAFAFTSEHQIHALDHILIVTHANGFQPSLIRLISSRSFFHDCSSKRLDICSSRLSGCIGDTWHNLRADPLNGYKQPVRQKEEPSTVDNHIHPHTCTQPIALLLNAPIRSSEQVRAHSINSQAPTRVQDIHWLALLRFQPDSFNEPPHAFLNRLLPRSYPTRAKQRRNSLAPQRPVLSIARAENRRVALEVEVRVAVCFAETAALVVDCVQSRAVGYND